MNKIINIKDLKDGKIHNLKLEEECAGHLIVSYKTQGMNMGSPDVVHFAIYRARKTTAVLESNDHFILKRFVEQRERSSVEYEEEVVTWALYTTGTDPWNAGAPKIFGKFPRKTYSWVVAGVLMDDLGIVDETKRVYYSAKIVNIDELKEIEEQKLESAKATLSMIDNYLEGTSL
jgi:hypothetical protein